MSYSAKEHGYSVHSTIKKAQSYRVSHRTSTLPCLHASDGESFPVDHQAMHQPLPRTADSLSLQQDPRSEVIIEDLVNAQSLNMGIAYPDIYAVCPRWL